MKIENLENYVEINLGDIDNAINWTERNGGPFGWDFSDEKLSKYMSANSEHDVKVERHSTKMERVYLSYDGMKIPLYFNVDFLGTYTPHCHIFPDGDETMSLVKYTSLFKALGDLSKYKKEHPSAKGGVTQKSLKVRVEYELEELMFLFEYYRLGKFEFSYEWGENPQEVFILKDDKPFIKVNLKDFEKGYALQDILRMRDILKNISLFYSKE